MTSNYKSGKVSTDKQWESLLDSATEKVFAKFTDTFQVWLKNHLSELVERAAAANDGKTTNLGQYTQGILYQIVEDSMFTGVEKDYVIKVGGNFSVNAKGSAKVKSSGDSSIETKGDSNTEVHGNSVTKVFGSTSTVVEGAATASYLGAVTSNVAGMSTTTLGGGRATFVGGLNSNVIGGASLNMHLGPVLSLNYLATSSVTYGNVAKLVFGSDEKWIVGSAFSFNSIAEVKFTPKSTKLELASFKTNILNGGASITDARNAAMQAGNYALSQMSTGCSFVYGGMSACARALYLIF